MLAAGGNVVKTGKDFLYRLIQLTFQEGIDNSHVRLLTKERQQAWLYGYTTGREWARGSTKTVVQGRAGEAILDM